MEFANGFGKLYRNDIGRVFCSEARQRGGNLIAKIFEISLTSFVFGAN
jgi:hypothetical protein